MWAQSKAWFCLRTVPQDGIDGCQETTSQSERRTGRRERESVQGEERGNRSVREKREGTGMWERRERREKKKWRERREKRNKKLIKLIQLLSVPLQICNGTVAMLYNFWDLAHLIKLHFCVWCGKCAKYLAFDTFATPAVDALRIPQFLSI